MLIQTHSTGAIVFIHKLNNIELIIQYIFFNEKVQKMQLILLNLTISINIFQKLYSEGIHFYVYLS